MRKAIVGVIGLLFAILAICFTSCTSKSQVTDPTVKSKTTTVDLPTGQRLVDVKIDNATVFYLTRPFEKGERATTHTLSSAHSTLLIVEHEIGDIQSLGHRHDTQMLREHLRRLDRE